MELRLTVEQPGTAGGRDVLVESDGGAPVHALLEALALEAGNGDGRTVSAGVVRRTGELLRGATPVGACDLRDGDVLALETVDAADSTAPHEVPEPDDDAVAELVVVGGPLLGTRVALATGDHIVGRGPGADVVLSDASLSRRHLRIAVDDDAIEVADLGSSNGTFVEGVAVSRPRELGPGQVLEIGRTLITFEPVTGDRNGHMPAHGGTVQFNRPPRVGRPGPTPGVSVPAPPAKGEKRSLPLGAALIPLVLAGGIFLATGSPVMLLLGAMTPVMATYSWWDARRREQRGHATASSRFESALEEAISTLEGARAIEAEQLRAAAPGADELRARARSLEASLWERRPDDPDFLALRVGVADRASELSSELAPGGDDETRRAAQARLDESRMLTSVPVRVPAGGLAVVGRADVTVGLARWLIAQTVVLHSPAEVAIAAALGGDSQPDWEWLKWVPHADGGARLAIGPDAAGALLADIESPPGRETVLLIDGALGIERARIAGAFRERVHVIWTGAHAREAPGGCRTIVECEDAVARLRATHVETGETIEDVSVDAVSAGWAEDVARSLAAVRDGAAPDARGTVPNRVSLLELLQLPDPTPHALAGLWQARGDDLSAPIGATADGAFRVDPARTDGLRALIGGMPGAGKSELLQSMVAALAVRHPPNRLAFLLVDYKGGAAFKDCVDLPHCAGLITDLDARLAERARISLLAELRRREAVLAEAGARNLAELTRRAPDAAPPSLLVIVDEFATLVREVPAFVETMVDVAQRGRSLGLHLVLATQRPRGAVSDTIRANTNLRIAMRMADGGESQDILEAPDAASIPAGLPGRALALTGRKTGGDPELTAFQAAYAGGRSADLGEIEVRVAPFQLGVPHARPARVLSLGGSGGPNDLQVIVEAARLAAERLELERPAAPWLPPLPDRVDLLQLDPPASVEQVVLGLLDEPGRQRQPLATFDLQREGSLLIYGGSGSGKTTLLRTIAVSLAARTNPHEVHLYALDFASRGLRALEKLPHVGSVIPGDDRERVLRLLTNLRGAMVQRRELLSAQSVAAVGELSGSAQAPRIVVLLDGYAAFATAMERSGGGEPLQMLQRVAAEGRPLGIHLVVTADRRADVPGGLAGVAGARIVLRMTDPDDYAALGMPRVAAGSELPPGRGLARDGMELQAAIVDDVAAVAARLAERHSGLHAPRIRALPAQVTVKRSPAPSAPLVAVAGIGGDMLRPVEVDLREDHFLVVGPPRSGRSTALGTLTASLRRGTPGLECHLLAPRRSPLMEVDGWTSMGKGADACRTMADRLAALVEDRVPDAPPVLVVVDDANEIGELLPLETLMRRGRDAGVRLLAAAESHATHRAFGGWVRELRNGRRGLLLMPEPETDGDLLGVRLPRSALAPSAPGRGYAVGDGMAELLQVAS